MTRGSLQPAALGDQPEAIRFQEIREQVVDVCRKLVREGLVRLSAGNVSVRHESGYVAMTPSGVAYEGMTADDIVIVDLHGSVIDGQLKPSSEMPMHLAILRERSDVNAVVHTHSVYALGFAVVGKEIPIISNEVLNVRNSIPVADYATPSTEELGQAALKALGESQRQGVLLQNHGALAIGESLAETYAAAVNIEIAAQVYALALQIGDPIVLTDDQISTVFEKYFGTEWRS